jgi:hypothetical protein
MMPPELTDGQITAVDIYKLMTEMRIDLASMTERSATTKKDVDDHESRLRVVETSLIKVRTIASSIGAAAGIIASIIGELIKNAH